MFRSSPYRQQILDNNRNVLLEALTRLGISQGCVTYEGGGDSGGVESVSCEPVSLELLLATEQVVLWHTTVAQNTEGQMECRLVTDKPCSLGEALGRFAEEWVNQEHAGWENNDGGAGSVTITVAEKRFELEHREFYTESTLYEYSL